MKKINVKDLSIKYYDKDYIYEIVVYNYNFIIKRIYCRNIYKECEFITLRNNCSDVKKIIYNGNKNIKYDLSKKDKVNIINSIFNSLLMSNICNDCIDLLELKRQILNSYINIIISNEDISLSSIDNSDKLDIILLDTEEIIGSVNFNEDDFKIEVDEFYYESVLKLVHNYLCLFRNDNYNKKLSIKV